MPKKISDDTAIVKKTDDMFSVELFNQEESQRIATNIKELLGVIGKIGSKLPKPVLVALLGSVFLGSIFVDTDLLQRSGTLWSIILDTQNLSILVKSVSYGLGLLGVFNISNLYKKLDRATQSLDPDLIVQRTPDPRLAQLQVANTLLNAKNLVLEDQVNSLHAKMTEDQNFIHGLVGIIQELSLTQAANPKLQEILLQAMKHVDSHTKNYSAENEKKLITEQPISSTTEVPVPTAVRQSLRVMHTPGKGWSKADLCASEADSDFDQISSLSLASP